MTAMTHWVGKIATRDLSSLAPYRHLDSWSLRGDTNEIYWLKLPYGNDDAFRKLPLLGRWSAGSDGKMIREGKRIPDTSLPSDGWLPISSLLPIATPQRGAPGMPALAVDFHLENTDTELPATSLLCRSEDLLDWASMALAPRVECLHFACCQDGRAFVIGTPLPPLPGSGFYRIGRLWLPCGWQLPNHVWPELLEDVLGLGRNRMCLFHPNGSYEEMDEENVVPASRAALRTSITS